MVDSSHNILNALFIITDFEQSNCFDKSSTLSKSYLSLVGIENDTIVAINNSY